MADRSLSSNLSDPMPDGLEFMEEYHDRLRMLIDAAIWPLGSVGGTGDAVTASCDPALTYGLVEHMRFGITWANTNTGDMVLSVDGLTPVPVLGADGGAMVAGAAVAGTRALLEYVGSAFLIIGGSGSGSGAAPYYLEITASTTWTKPGGYADDAVVDFEAWGAGASGARNSNGSVPGGGGGGGGAYVARRMRYADVPSSLSVVIGAGGTGVSGVNNGNNGGSTTIGSLLTAPGGTGGRSGGQGGGGAGPAGAGALGVGGPGGGGDSDGDAKGIWGGAGGGSGSTGTAGSVGRDAVFGGASGAGGSTSAAGTHAGGVSLFGGDGGTGGQAGGPGSAPGGGGGGARTGGTSGAGARGEVRVWIWN